ncbi:MAG: glutathione S-transferase [Zoogloeaceae bacterium]|nr:glutathione S-transferase [Zoogloeaceae bacterium]
MSATTSSLTLHGFALSGHSHRVELFLSLLGLPYECIDVDLAGGAHKRPEFLAKNVFGQVPVLEDGPVVLADSNAILVYLARRYGAGKAIDWLPAAPQVEAEVQRWLTVAAGLLAFGPARARLKVLFKADVDADDARKRADQLLTVMDGELARRAWLAGDAPTLADIANYSYVAHAPDGHVPLDPYPNVRAWLARIEALPGFVPLRGAA